MSLCQDTDCDRMCPAARRPYRDGHRPLPEGHRSRPRLVGPAQRVRAGPDPIPTASARATAAPGAADGIPDQVAVAWSDMINAFLHDVAMADRLPQADLPHRREQHAVLQSLLAAAPGAGTTILDGSTAGAASVEIADHAVIARFVNPSWGGPDYRGVLVGRWHTAQVPDDAEAALVGVMVDHATALVQPERTSAGAHAGHAEHPGSALSATQRIAAASGILMSLHHLSTSQARSLLSRASEHTHRPVIDIADAVLRTGALPTQPRDPATGGPGRSSPDSQPTHTVPVIGRP